MLDLYGQFVEFPGADGIRYLARVGAVQLAANVDEISFETYMTVAGSPLCSLPRMVVTGSEETSRSRPGAAVQTVAHRARKQTKKAASFTVLMLFATMHSEKPPEGGSADRRC